FMSRFPTLAALARARPKAVMEQWEGLGYYARARNLHLLAKRVAETGNQIPDDPEELRTLPGIGRYTAGAVACFAFEKPVPAVDTNVRRVLLSVFFGDDQRLPRQRSTRERNTRQRLTRQRPIPQCLIWSLAAALVPKDGKRAWKFNQAIMELGALICVARKPKCTQCPVRPNCKTGR